MGLSRNLARARFLSRIVDALRLPCESPRPLSLHVLLVERDVHRLLHDLGHVLERILDRVIARRFSCSLDALR